MTHTPGPWTVEYDDVENSYVILGQDNTVHSRIIPLPPSYHPDGLKGMAKEARANANLYAAAPELLRAVNMAIECIEGLRAKDDCSSELVLDDLRQAITKAKGG